MTPPFFYGVGRFNYTTGRLTAVVQFAHEVGVPKRQRIIAGDLGIAAHGELTSGRKFAREDLKGKNEGIANVFHDQPERGVGIGTVNDPEFLFAIGNSPQNDAAIGIIALV